MSAAKRLLSPTRHSFQQLSDSFSDRTIALHQCCREPQRELNPVAVAPSYFSQYRKTVVCFAQAEQSDRVPVPHLGIVANHALGIGELAFGRIQIAAAGRSVAEPHMNEGATDRDETANLNQRLARVIDAKIEDGVMPGTAAALPLDDQNRRRLAPANITALSLGRIERREESIDELTLSAGVGLRHRGPHSIPQHHVGLH